MVKRRCSAGRCWDPRGRPGRGGSPVPAVTQGGEGEGFGLIPTTHPPSVRSPNGAPRIPGRGLGAGRGDARGSVDPSEGPMRHPEPTAEAGVEVGVPVPPPSAAGTGGGSHGSGHGAAVGGTRQGRE